MNEEEKDLEAGGGQAAGDAAGESTAGETVDTELSRALEATLSGLNESIDRMESIVRQLEAGEADWEESVRLLAEANELAINSSQQLEQAVQDVVYGSEEDAGQLELPREQMEGD